MRFLVALPLWTLLFSVGLAHAEGLKCQPQLRLYYFNGVLNSHEAARQSLFALAPTLDASQIKQQGLVWRPKNATVGYNQTHGLLDLLEACRQKSDEAAKNFWLWLGNVANAPQWYRDGITALYLAPNDSSEGLVSTLLALDVEDDLKSGARVLVVAHSQGNFFANTAWEKVKFGDWVTGESPDMARMGIVGVATPASSVAGGGPHVTLTSDWVVNKIPTALPANTTNHVPRPGYFDHEFIAHYLNGDVSGSRIREGMAAQISRAARAPDDDVGSCENWFQAFFAQKPACKI